MKVVPDDTSLLGGILIVGGVFLYFFLTACSTTPRTNTAVPALDTARAKTIQITNDITDAKGGIRRARTYSERLDYKASLIR